MTGCEFTTPFLYMKIIKIQFDSKFFNVRDTLECGQLFRFVSYRKGYLLFSKDKCCYCYNQEDCAIIECLESDKDYFTKYFDLQRDYNKIYNDAIHQNVSVLSVAAELGKGIRILNQDPVETLFSFIISQNNNIPRIKGIIEKLCMMLGDKRTQFDYTYYTFPSIKAMATQSLEFYKSVGLGYRAEYIRKMAVIIDQGFDVYKLSDMSTVELKKHLISLYGVGPKVADCILLFGFHKCDSFPVDTWIEKVYHDNFSGRLNNRNKITEYFVDMFGDNSGYFQQYLFYYKRSLEEKRK